MIDLDSAQAALAELQPDLISAYQTAAANWRILLTEHPELGAPCSTTTRAGFVHNHVVGEIAPAVEARDGYEMTDALGFHAIRAGYEILLRFKYLGDGSPSNVATDQQRLLARQAFDDDMLLALDHPSALTPPTLLTCGYTLTNDGKIGRIEIRRDCRGHLPWCYDIFGGTTVIAPLIIDTLDDTTKPARITKPGKTKRTTGKAATDAKPS